MQILSNDQFFSVKKILDSLSDMESMPMQDSIETVSHDSEPSKPKTDSLLVATIDSDTMTFDSDQLEDKSTEDLPDTQPLEEYIPVQFESVEMTESELPVLEQQSLSHQEQPSLPDPDELTFDEVEVTEEHELNVPDLPRQTEVKFLSEPESPPLPLPQSLDNLDDPRIENQSSDLPLPELTEIDVNEIDPVKDFPSENELHIKEISESLQSENKKYLEEIQVLFEKEDRDILPPSNELNELVVFSQL